MTGGYGLLSHGGTENRNMPERVTDGLPGGEVGVVRDVSCGPYHTMVAMLKCKVCAKSEHVNSSCVEGRPLWVCVWSQGGAKGEGSGCTYNL